MTIGKCRMSPSTRSSAGASRRRNHFMQLTSNTYSKWTKCAIMTRFECTATSVNKIGGRIATIANTGVVADIVIVTLQAGMSDYKCTAKTVHEIARNDCQPKCALQSIGSEAARLSSFLPKTVTENGCNNCQLQFKRTAR